ncbi:MAG: phosphoglucomutase/phosphomannomutase family protein, partial [Verrucomicrobia bacterium]|nr:phosphoglucomutase/phosphomannomutase family protein [Verrucomicrobiota bacterium]
MAVADPIQFGTDGWRAVVAEDFTFANVRRVAQAVAAYWRGEGAKKGQPSRAVVGYDRRFLSEKFAATVAEVFAANGITTLYAEQACPSPAVSYAVKQRGLIGGVMITASHNPPEFNGIKIKADFGGPADTEITGQIEARMDREPVKRTVFETARGQRSIVIEDVRRAHCEAIARFVDLDRIAGAGLKV